MEDAADPYWWFLDKVTSLIGMDPRWTGITFAQAASLACVKYGIDVRRLV